jgi:hypothetical protein
VVTLTDLDIPRTNSINVTAIAKDEVTLTCAELTPPMMGRRSISSDLNFAAFNEKSPRL